MIIPTFIIIFLIHKVVLIPIVPVQNKTPRDNRIPSSSFSHRYPTQSPYFTKPQYYPPKYETSQKQMESLMEVLNSISQNDNLQCVPKIICEVTSDMLTGRQNSLNLPVNIDIKTLLGLLSTYGAFRSPLLYFGQAALLGYSSKGDANICRSSYPNCPSDPDKLVQYLNNHKGGFFRYFRGVNSPNSYTNFQNFNKFTRAEKRIQNHPMSVPPWEKPNNKIAFPEDDIRESFSLTNDYFPVRKGKSDWKFLEETTEKYFNFYDDNEVLDIQKPLPNHKATPFIFPLRIGTGELILDNEELDIDTPTWKF